MVPGELLKSLGEIFNKTCETLMWFFVPMLFVGFWSHFRRDVKYEERVLITAFIVVNMTMMILRYCYFQPHVSQRWSLPLVTFTIFYIPVGLQVVGNWLNNKCSPSKQKVDIPEDRRLSWFIILLFIGIGICLPKLIRPVRIEKHGYREVAKWLRENSVVTEIVAVQDKRIAFYANRPHKRTQMGTKKLSCRMIPAQAAYVVVISAKEKLTEAEMNFNRKVRKKYSVWVNERKKKKRIVIYEVL